MPATKDIFLIGFASGIAAARPGAALGPLHLQQSSAMATLNSRQLTLHWQPSLHRHSDGLDTKLEIVTHLCRSLADQIMYFVSKKEFFVVLGGDHSCAIGTWSGAAECVKKEQDGRIGLIWIDAHMDSHTFDTTPSGNIHGMPLACLLGYGSPSLTHMANFSPVLRPEQVCLIGVRSYEPFEADLLKRLGVRVYFMDEVKRRGFSVVMQEAVDVVKKNTVGYGISLDIDSIDPVDAPATGTSEPNGIRAKDLMAGLRLCAGDPLLIGFEVAEFDPKLDINDMTEKLIPELIAAVTGGLVNV